MKVKKVLTPVTQLPIIDSFKKITLLLKHNISLIILIVTLISIVYGLSLRNGFISGDDYDGVAFNPNSSSFSAALSTKSINNMFYSVLFLLITNRSLALHLVSIVLHILFVTEVFVISYLLLGKKIATMVTLIFAVHSINSETVFWSAAQMYLIYALITGLCLVFFLLYKNSQHKKYLIISVALYLMALPVYRTPWILSFGYTAIILELFWFDSKPKQKIITGAFFISVFAVYMLILGVGQLSLRAYDLTTYYQSTQDSTPILNRLPVTIYRSLETLIAPLNLSLYHEEYLSANIYLVMIVVTLLYFYVLYRLFKRNKKLLALNLIFLASLAPIFSPTLIAWIFAERYLYMSSCFMIMFFCVLITNYETKRKLTKLSFYVTLVIVIVFSIRTFIRSFDWQNSKTLWTATLPYANSGEHIYNNLADVYYSEGNYELAIQTLQKALEITPNYADAMHNMGNNYIALGNIDEAEKYYLMASDTNPYLYQSFFNVASIEMNKGNKAKAIDYLHKVVQLNPSYNNAQAILSQLESTN